MADDQERIYTIPLKGAYNAPTSRRAQAAMNEVKSFVTQHMNVDEDDLWIDGSVNDAIFARGMEKPPRKLRVHAIKFEEDGVVEISVPEE